MPFTHRAFAVLTGIALLAGVPQTVSAQRNSVRPLPTSRTQPGTAAGQARPEPRSTIVELELLTSGLGAGLEAQQWREAMEPLGVSLLIRQPGFEDKPEIQEQTFGTLRRVKAIGTLEGNGRISFPNRSFALNEVRKLGEWIDELKVYGAQGSPEGQPLWGLTKTQFGGIYAALSAKVEDEVEGLTLPEALAALKLPRSYPVRITTAAEKWASSSEPVRQKYRGLSQGTALSILLNEYGLGFRPLRTPAGQVELAVEPLTNREDVWPAGWPFADSRQETAPKLFELIKIELQDVEFTDVLDAVAEVTGVPILVDDRALADAGIDLDSLRVTYPRRQASWSVALRGLTFQHRLSRDLRIDEQGQPFVWITTLTVGRK